MSALDSRLKAKSQVCYASWIWRKLMIMLIGSFFSIYFGDVGSRKNGGSGFIFVFLQFVSPFWSMVARVVFFRVLGAFRQGDPLSPMLFVIVMEAFSRLIDKAIGAGMLSGFLWVGWIMILWISHLLFADDTLIFCEADPDHLFHLRSILIWFEATSGLRINLGKSELVQVGEVPFLEELADILGCKTTTLTYEVFGFTFGGFLQIERYMESNCGKNGASFGGLEADVSL
jgi:hypothetical protein